MPGMRKYCNSSFEDKTNWLVWWYKNGKKRVGMNLLDSSYHINHLYYRLLPKFCLKLSWRLLPLKRSAETFFCFFELLYILKLYRKHDYQGKI